MIVEKETELNYPQRDGSTKRKHLEAVAKQTGKIPEELKVPEVPKAGLYVKWVFDNLSTTREFNETGPQLIKQSDIYYWCKLRGIVLDEWHLFTLQKLDIAAVNSLVRCLKEARNA